MMSFGTLPPDCGRGGMRGGFIYLCVVYVGCVHVFIYVVVYGVFLIRWIVAYRKYAHALAHETATKHFGTSKFGIRFVWLDTRVLCAVCCMLCVVVYGVALRKQQRCGCMRLENWTAPNCRVTWRLAKRNEMVRGEGAQKDGGRQSNIEGDREREWEGEWVSGCVGGGEQRTCACACFWQRVTTVNVSEGARILPQSRSTAAVGYVTGRARKIWVGICYTYVYVCYIFGDGRQAAIYDMNMKALTLREWMCSALDAWTRPLLM